MIAFPLTSVVVLAEHRDISVVLCYSKSMTQIFTTCWLTCASLCLWLAGCVELVKLFILEINLLVRDEKLLSPPPPLQTTHECFPLFHSFHGLHQQLNFISTLAVVCKGKNEL